MSNPLVSIIVPSYNQGAFIAETLNSILEQDYRPIEIIVMDGASTDNTVAVLHQYEGIPEVTWVSESDSGVVEAVNKGLIRSNGLIAGIQSSDDVYLPGAVSRGVQALLEDDRLGFVFGDIAKIDSEGREFSRTTLAPFSLEAFLSVQTWIPQPSTFFRLDLARQLGGWREDVPYAADTDLWLRMAFRAPARKIDVVLANRRVHGKQRDVHGDRIIRDYTKMIETSSDIAQAPAKLRRAARAGVLMLKNRYSPGQTYWVGLCRLWKACLLYPPLLLQTGGASLVPGYCPALGFTQKLKRKIFAA